MMMLDTQNVVMRMARDEKVMDRDNVSELRTLSNTRKAAMAVSSLNRLLGIERHRLAKEEEAREEAERLRPRTRQDFLSAGGRGSPDSSGRNSHNNHNRNDRQSPTLTSTRKTTTRNGKGSPKSNHKFQRSGLMDTSTAYDEEDSLGSPYIPRSEGVAIQPRTLTESEIEKALDIEEVSVYNSID